MVQAIFLESFYGNFFLFFFQFIFRLVIIIVILFFVSQVVRSSASPVSKICETKIVLEIVRASRPFLLKLQNRIFSKTSQCYVSLHSILQPSVGCFEVLMSAVNLQAWSMVTLLLKKLPIGGAFRCSVQIIRL